MGRRNLRGLELSFKPLKGGRGRGRWYKKIKGRMHYFGKGDGVTDKVGYREALAAFRQWEAQEQARSQSGVRTATARSLQYGMSALDGWPDNVDLEAARKQIANLKALGGDADTFARAADGEEHRRLLRTLSELSLDHLRKLAEVPRPRDAAKTAAPIIDQFLEAQRQRMERRRKLDGLRAKGQAVQEGRRENMSPGRFSRLATAVASFRKCVEKEPWDGTEACAARLVRSFREWSNEQLMAQKITPASFNQNVQCVRQFVGWAEANYILDRIPRDRKLFGKYQLKGTAKAIPIKELRKLWQHADDRGKAFLLLGLNCAYYAVDISDLKAEQVAGGYLQHHRGKTDVAVRYLLWAETRKYLKKVLPDSGLAFPGANGRPLVYYTDGEDGVPIRVDNVNNWWHRLTKAAGVAKGKAGYSFSNLRDTCASEVDKIDRQFTDLFSAHVDKRMARFYVDGEHFDTTGLDKVLRELEKRLAIWLPEPAQRQKSKQGK